jgi:hypothetical protein
VHAAASRVLNLEQLDLVFGKLETQALDDLVLLIDEL